MGSVVPRASTCFVAIVTLAAAVAGCRGGTSKAASAKDGHAPSEAGAASSTGGASETATLPAAEAAPPEGVRAIASAPFTGDFDQMVARRLIRVGAVANPRHPLDRSQHPRRREVRALHDGPVLPGRADGRPEQGAVHLRVLQRGVRPGAPAAGGDGEAEARPNVWFGNVEQIASERIGRETVTYVANIYKYYIAYRLTSEENSRRAAAEAAVKAGTG
jgi:hypothetical protein